MYKYQDNSTQSKRETENEMNGGRNSIIPKWIGGNNTNEETNRGTNK